MMGSSLCARLRQAQRNRPFTYSMILRRRLSELNLAMKKVGKPVGLVIFVNAKKP